MSDKIPVIIISDNLKLYELLSAYVKDFPNFELQDKFSDRSEIYNFVSSVDKSLIFADMDYSTPEHIEKIAHEYSVCKVVAIKENPDVNFIISIIRAGAKEMLTYPFIKSEFIDVMDRLSKQFENKCQKPEKCKMITLFSNKGGIGKTSIAANLALELAQITKENVALIDLNFQFGDVATFMDIQPTFDISYMFNNLELLNKDFLLNTMEKYKNTSLYVLADAPYIKQSKEITSKQVTKFIEILKDTFSYIVVDTSATFDAKTITTLDYSDIILLVSIVNLPALRNCQRCLNLFDKLGYDEKKVQILINRYMENDEITIHDVEKLLNKKVYWKIPNNYFALMASINKGILLSELNPESNVAKSYKDLAINVSDSVFRTRLVNKYSPENERKLENILER